MSLPLGVDRESQRLPPQQAKSRHTFFAGVIILVFSVLVLQLFLLQVVEGERYRRLSQDNYLRITPIPATRGDILDADGKVLVTSRPAFSVFYWYLDEERANEVIPQLADLLDIDESDIKAAISKYKGRYFEPVPIAKDITPMQYTALVEDAPRLPGVFIDSVPIRCYPEKGLAAHVLGYVGEITGAQLENPRWAGYKMGDIVGQGGLESYYQDTLRGKDGGYQVEVDFRGRPTGHIGKGIEPRPGNDLVVTLDSTVQKAAEEALNQVLRTHPKAKGASCVVLDAKSAAVLAMVSVPSFDPDRIVTGISQKELNDLVAKGKWRFSNLAITGLYPPGSTFKIVTAVAALSEGKVAETETFFDPGYHPSVPSLHCHKAGGHGSVDLKRALEVSCNVFFYEMGRRLGVDVIADYADRLGLGKKTGIDLYGEFYGTVPSSQWKQKAYGEGRVAQPEFLYSEHMMVAMGQAFHLDTPLQMASVVQAVANDGVRMKPHIASKVVGPDGETVEEFLPETVDVLDVEKDVFRVVKEGMLRVVNSPNGTAYWAFNGFPHKVAGKTGTAENPFGENHSWFVGFGPFEDPEVVVVVVVDQGGSGSAVAAPAARAVFEACLSRGPE